MYQFSTNQNFTKILILLKYKYKSRLFCTTLMLNTVSMDPTNYAVCFQETLTVIKPAKKQQRKEG